MRQAEEAARVVREEAAIVATARVREALEAATVAREEAAIIAKARVQEDLDAGRVASGELDAEVGVDSIQVVVPRVDTDTKMVNEHGYRRVYKKCSQPHCQSYAKGYGVCRRHGAPMKKCKRDGCKKTGQRGGFCKAHGGSITCSVDGCSLAVFRGLKCCKHNNNPPVKLCEVVVIDTPSIMSFDQNIVQNILQFAGGWDN